jgi:predicted metalloprotease with PDZ domain
MGLRRFFSPSALASLLLAAPLLLSGQTQPLPQPLPPEPPLPTPQDVAFPGVITLAVDASDLDHAIFSVHETIPVQGGQSFTLLYPQWLPGNHSPSGPIDKLAGLILTAGGKKLEWRRDPVEITAFHVDIPAGVTSLIADFQFLSAVSTKQGRIMMTPDMLSLQWNTVALYPAGYFSRDLPFSASVTLPPGFSQASSLEVAGSEGSVVRFKTTDFETLVDSPLIAGRYYRRFELAPTGAAKVSLDVVADRPDYLNATNEQIAAHAAMVSQAYKLFGTRHYAHYDFLLSLSDKLGGIGLEHQQSSEDGTIPKYFTDWNKTPAGRDLLSHEFTHSWNGKFRRPADLWTANFNTPMRDSLLWTYEGQTQYWGVVLAARSGLLTKGQALDSIALTAASYDMRVGRAWRPLEDTTNDPIIARRRPLPWLSWQRSEDYYSEGQLIWLDADTLIRSQSGGKRSLDDFAKSFFGIDPGSTIAAPYQFADVVASLNAAQPGDWGPFLRNRLDGHGPGAPLDGIKRGGYRLIYTDVESDYAKSAEARRKTTDLTFSIGVILAKDGSINDVLWDSPAFKAGLTEGTQLIAVNGNSFDADDLKDAIQAGIAGKSAIALLVKDKDHYRTIALDYHGGLRYPHLERIAEQPALLDDILTPLP